MPRKAKQKDIKELVQEVVDKFGPDSPPSKSQMRRFVLERVEDFSGVSGTGVVAEGVLFTNGYAALTWLTHLGCNAIYHSVDVLMKIHGHEGRTKLVWVDPE